MLAEKPWQRALTFLFPQGWTYKEAKQLVHDAEDDATEKHEDS